jgi:hypothetical protein
MGKQVEMLEHHSDLAADRIDPPDIAGERHSVDDDLAVLKVFKPVDATQ